eukprot:XP_008185090.1 PREDICTED: putative nuclease HARBI1 [Acyrthosiphon pisum]
MPDAKTKAVLGDHIHVHKSTVFRVIKKVSEAIAFLKPKYIQMPRSQTEIDLVQHDFFLTRNFPKVIGAIDCTHIKIQSPNSDIGEKFRNRKGFFSVNVQAVCDGGYACRNYMMTPLGNPTSESELRYQKAQIGTRNVIERTFGVWKRRFPVLSLGIRTQIQTTLTTIIATAVLHNMLIAANEPLVIDETLLTADMLDQVPVLRHLIETVFN